MKVIAIAHFRNTHKFDLDGDGKYSPHEFHVAPGAIFQIGTSEDYSKLPRPEQRLIDGLVAANRIAPATEANIKSIRAQAAQEAAAEEKRSRTLATATGGGAAVQELRDLVADLQKQVADLKKK